MGFDDYARDAGDAFHHQGLAHTTAPGRSGSQPVLARVEPSPTAPQQNTIRSSSDSRSRTSIDLAAPAWCTPCTARWPT